LDKAVARKILIPSKIEKPDKPNISLDTMMLKTECSKKAKRVPTCPSMLIHDYVELHKSKEMEATKSNNGEKPGSNFHPSSSKNQQLSSKNRVEDSREPAVNEEEEQIEKRKKVISFVFHNNDFMYSLYIGNQHVILFCHVNYFIKL